MPVQAVRRTAPVDDPRRFVGLHVLNVSRGGVGAVSQESLDQTEPLLIFFPPLGAGRGSDVAGRVVRCNRHEERFSVGIVFDHPAPLGAESQPAADEVQAGDASFRTPDYL
jgi:hypothetical protein